MRRCSGVNFGWVEGSAMLRISRGGVHGVKVSHRCGAFNSLDGARSERITQFEAIIVAGPEVAGDGPAVADVPIDVLAVAHAKADIAIEDGVIAGFVDRETIGGWGDHGLAAH